MDSALDIRGGQTRYSANDVLNVCGVIEVGCVPVAYRKLVKAMKQIVSCLSAISDSGDVALGSDVGVEGCILNNLSLGRVCNGQATQSNPGSTPEWIKALSHGKSGLLTKENRPIIYNFGALHHSFLLDLTDAITSVNSFCHSPGE